MDADHQFSFSESLPLITSWENILTLGLHRRFDPGKPDDITNTYQDQSLFDSDLCPLYLSLFIPFVSFFPKIFYEFENLIKSYIFFEYLLFSCNFKNFFDRDPVKPVKFLPQGNYGTVKARQ